MYYYIPLYEKSIANEQTAYNETYSNPGLQ